MPFSLPAPLLKNPAVPTHISYLAVFKHYHYMDFSIMHVFCIHLQKQGNMFSVQGCSLRAILDLLTS